MAFIDGSRDVLLHAEKFEIRGRFRVLHRVIPFVGPGHGDGDRMLDVDRDVHIAASGCRMIDTAGMQAGGLHGDGRAVGGSPVENTIVLGAGDGGKYAEQQRGKKREFAHTTNIRRLNEARLLILEGMDYGSTGAE